MVSALMPKDDCLPPMQGLQMSALHRQIQIGLTICC